MKRPVAALMAAIVTISTLNATEAIAVAEPIPTSVSDQIPVSLEDSGQIKVAGIKSKTVKASVKALVYFLRNNVDTVIRRLQNEPGMPVAKRYLNIIRNHSGELADKLETLLTLDEIPLQMIYDQTYNFMRTKLGLSHNTSHWVDWILKLAVDWGLF